MSQAPRRSASVGRDRLVADPHSVAAALLECAMVSDLGPRVVVRITEVEAYGGPGEDPGSHAHRGRTPRNAAMFGPVGHAYVYLSYGVHWCLNVVAHQADGAGGVLIRAGEVTAGREVARTRRPAARNDTDLARGPAKLAACLAISHAQDGADLLDPASRLRLEPALPVADPSANRKPDVLWQSGPRTGVAGAGAATPWRFWLPGEPTVSRYRRAHPRA